MMPIARPNEVKPSVINEITLVNTGELFINLLTASVTLSKLATSKPTPIISAPIPVAANAIRNIFNAPVVVPTTILYAAVRAVNNA